ncbi:MAG: hypothetical protein QOI37_1640, partial [Chloroflexota bacterium]|nr:hypothetical protein [Chloroflexota bacterium]
MAADQPPTTPDGLPVGEPTASVP